MKNWSFAKHTLLSVTITLLIRFVTHKPVSQTSSIGIIGGTDGPTTIFVSHTDGLLSSRNILWMVTLPLLLLLNLPIRWIGRKMNCCGDKPQE